MALRHFSKRCFMEIVMKKTRKSAEKGSPSPNSSLNDMLVDTQKSSELNIDEKYRRADVIGESADTSVTRNIFSALSAEMRGSQYKIRKPEQQAEWAGVKSTCQKQLGKNILRFQSVYDALIKACEGAPSHLLGVLKSDEQGTIISYPKDLPDAVHQMLLNLKSGHSGYDKEELIELVVEDYNLSYAHFIKPQAAILIKRFDVAKASKSNIVDIKIGQTGSLFDQTSAQLAFSESEDVNWVDACSLIRTSKLLSLRINELRNRLVSTNLRSCLSSALAYYHKGGGNKQSGVGELDLISEGAEGLMYACDMYVYGCNAKFTTYADYWIKLKISRYIKNNNAVRIPIHATDLVNTILRYFRAETKKNLDFDLPTKKQVERAISEDISDSIWELAMNRYNNVPVNISCVNNVIGEEEMSFDVFSEVVDENEDHIRKAEFAHIIETAEALVSSGDMTSRQFRILELKYIDERTHAEIAEEIGDGCSDKTVRSESKRALDAIKFELGLTNVKGK